MLKILVIGNSFSENATFYLHQIASSAGIETKVVNLYIGGCPLEKHWTNILENGRYYRYELNGFYDNESEKNLVGIADIIESDDWDVIISQQASYNSGVQSSYTPFAEKIFAYLHKKKPKAKLVLQQTWSYESDTKHPGFAEYHYNQEEMYKRLTECYLTTSQKLNVALIPSGEIIQTIRKLPYFAEHAVIMNSDGYHLSHFYGKYLAALIWFKYLMGGEIEKVTYIPSNRYFKDFEIDENIIIELKKFVADFSSQLI